MRILKPWMCSNYLLLKWAWCIMFWQAEERGGEAAGRRRAIEARRGGEEACGGEKERRGGADSFSRGGEGADGAGGAAETGWATERGLLTVKRRKPESCWLCSLNKWLFVWRMSAWGGWSEGPRGSRAAAGGESTHHATKPTGAHGEKEGGCAYMTHYYTVAISAGIRIEDT